jgi:hypothetical protein
VAIGTLLSAGSAVQKAASDLDMAAKVRTWEEVGGSQKIVECAGIVAKLF